MPEAQKNAIIELLGYLRGKYGNLKVYGHRDLDSTACPGKNYPFDEIVHGKVAEETKGDEGVNIIMPLLSKGSAGNEVKTLQRLLYAMGYNLGTNPIDGDFGKNTDTAVKLYQKNNGLAVDGVVGKGTWNKLLKG
jgi:N-acetyl-anhydromuramyl-L-alanine amidase AmpD